MELLNDYDRGFCAYEEGKSFDQYQTKEWRLGWLDAESEDTEGWTS